MNRKLLACLALLLAAGAASASSFERGVSEFRAGRFASAWGNFYGAANAGDPDAARVALHMLKYGPMLYGGYWDASAEEVESWQQAASLARARPMPVYRPPAKTAPRQLLTH